MTKASQLLVRQHLEAGFLKVERQLPENEHLRVLPHAAAHDLVEPPAAQQEVGALALQALIAQHHAHVLLYPEELGGERALLRAEVCCNMRCIAAMGVFI